MTFIGVVYRWGKDYPRGTSTLPVALSLRKMPPDPHQSSTVFLCEDRLGPMHGQVTCEFGVHSAVVPQPSLGQKCQEPEVQVHYA